MNKKMIFSKTNYKNCKMEKVVKFCLLAFSVGFITTSLIIYKFDNKLFKIFKKK